MAGKRKALVPSNLCVACGQCAKECPKQAIHIHRGMYAVVNETCVGCGKCAGACPAGIIELVDVSGGAQDRASGARKSGGGAQR